MKPIANQKIVSINKEKVEKSTGKKRPYFLAYVDTIERAAQDLKNSAFKVFMYLFTNENNYTFGLSPLDIANTYGISIDAARDGIKTLIEKNYLVEEDKNIYTFYDNVKRKPIALPDDVAKKMEKKVFINNTTGERKEYTFQEIVEIVKDEEYAKQIWEGNE